MATSRCPFCDAPALALYENIYDDRYGFPGEFTVFRCPNCGHCFTDAKASESEIGSLYSDYYPRAELDPASWAPPRNPHTFRAWWNGEYRAWAAVRPGVKVLDIGCGACESLGWYRSIGCDASGIEADTNMKKIADAQKFEVTIGVFRDGLYPDNTFDCVTMDQVIEHFADTVVLLRAVRRILKPGGSLIVTTPNVDGWERMLSGRGWINWHVPYHFHHFTKRSLALAAEKSGFSVGRCATITSSEWMFYQLMHWTMFPQPGEPSAFWSPKAKSATTLPVTKKVAQGLWRGLRAAQLTHLATRIADLADRGSNLFAVLENTDPSVTP